MASRKPFVLICGVIIIISVLLSILLVSPVIEIQEQYRSQKVRPVRFGRQKSKVNPNLSAADVTVINNICVNPTRNEKMNYTQRAFRVHLQSYDLDVNAIGSNDTNKEVANRVHFTINAHNGFDINDINEWIVHRNYTANMPENWTFIDFPAYFPLYWRCKINLYIYFDRTLTYSYKVKKWSETHLNSSDLVLMAPTLTCAQTLYYTPHHTMGMTQLMDVSDILNHTKPVCFSHGIFVKLEKDTESLHGMAAALSRAWNLTEYVCPEYYTMFLQRNTTRRLLNADELVRALIEHGFTRVRVEIFDGKTLLEQARLIRCTKVLIAVQGAGLNWYHFLPHNAKVMELTFNRWGSRYERRLLRNRSDIKPKVLKCKRVTPPYIWAKYARLWLNYTGPISKTMKTELLNTKSLIRTENVAHDSDCSCDVSTILTALDKSLIQ